MTGDEELNYLGLDDFYRAAAQELGVDVVAAQPMTNDTLAVRP
jgi:hypothetical protein